MYDDLKSFLNLCQHLKYWEAKTNSGMIYIHQISRVIISKIAENTK